MANFIYWAILTIAVCAAIGLSAAILKLWMAQAGLRFNFSLKRRKKTRRKESIFPFQPQPEPIPVPVDPPGHATPYRNVAVPEHDEFELMQAMKDAGRKAVDSSYGDYTQGEIDLVPDDEYASWDKAVKSSFQRRMGQEKTARVQPPNDGPRDKGEFLVLCVMAPRDCHFNGQDIQSFMRREGLALNTQRVYEAIDIEGVQFYATSAKHPGSFDTERVHQFETPAVNFIIDMRHCANHSKAFKRMLKVMDHMAKALGGDILDMSHQRLTQSSLMQCYSRLRNSTSQYRAAL